jgi:hypothetical protein
MYIEIVKNVVFMIIILNIIIIIMSNHPSMDRCPMPNAYISHLVFSVFLFHLPNSLLSVTATVRTSLTSSLDSVVLSLVSTSFQNLKYSPFISKNLFVYLFIHTKHRILSYPILSYRIPRQRQDHFFFSP